MATVLDADKEVFEAYMAFFQYQKVDISSQLYYQLDKE